MGGLVISILLGIQSLQVGCFQFCSSGHGLWSNVSRHDVLVQNNAFFFQSLHCV